MPADSHAAQLARPLPVSVGRVRSDQVARLGYTSIAVCAECRRPIVVTAPGDQWTHRDNGDRACNRSRSV